MANIRINDVPQRIQYEASNPTQSSFPIPFPFLANTDIVVWQDEVELSQGAAPGQYGLSGAGTASGGTMTLVTAAAAGTIITITGEMPIDRTSIYSPTISNLTGDDLNSDFNRLIIMVQELWTIQNYMMLQYMPYLELSQDIDVTVDRWLPILPATHVWRKNDDDTAIETAALPAFPVGSVGGNFPNDNRVVRTKIDNGENDIEETGIEVTDSDVMQSVSGSWGLDSAAELNLDATTNLNLQGQRWPAAIGANGTVIGVSAGILAYLNVPTTPSPTTTNVIPKFVNTTGSLGDSQFSESGTNLLLPADPTVALAAATKQYVDGLIGGTVASVTGTLNQVEVDNTDPVNPVVLLPNEIIAPGTVQAGNIKLDGNTISSEDVNGNLNYTPNGTGINILANAQVTSLTASQMVATDGSKNLVSVAFDPADLPYAVLQDGSPIYGVDAQVTDAYAITLSPAPSAYVEGMTVRFKANTQNTTGATLNVNGLGALAILKFHDQVLATGDIEAGQISTVVYDGTNWQLQSAVAIAPGGGTVTSVGVTSDTLVVTNTPITSSGNIDIELPASVSGKNLIYNGDFQLWQRGANGSASITVPAATSTGIYTADRWQGVTEVSQAATVAQEAGVTSGSYLCKFQRNAGQTGIGNMILLTSLTRSMCVGVAGQYLTLSFKAKKGADYSAASNLLNFIISSGTGSSDISLVNNFTGQVNYSDSVTLTGTLTEFSYTIATPLGADVTQLAVQFFMTPTGTAGADDSFSVTDVQLEVGENVTEFERVSLQEELNRCLFFYEKSFNLSTAPAQNAGVNSTHTFAQTVAASTTLYSDMIRFAGRKRIAPTITLFNPSAANAQARNLNTGTDASSTTAEDPVEVGYRISLTTPGGSGTSQTFGIHWTAEADLT